MADHTPELDPGDAASAEITMNRMMNTREENKKTRGELEEDIRKYGGEEKIDQMSITYLTIKSNVLLVLNWVAWASLLLLAFSSLAEAIR